MQPGCRTWNDLDVPAGSPSATLVTERLHVAGKSQSVRSSWLPSRGGNGSKTRGAAPNARPGRRCVIGTTTIHTETAHANNPGRLDSKCRIRLLAFRREAWTSPWTPDHFRGCEAGSRGRRVRRGAFSTGAAPRFPVRTTGTGRRSANDSSSPRRTFHGQEAGDGFGGWPRLIHHHVEGRKGLAARDAGDVLEHALGR